MFGIVVRGLRRIIAGAHLAQLGERLSNASIRRGNAFLVAQPALRSLLAALLAHVSYPGTAPGGMVRR